MKFGGKFEYFPNYYKKIKKKKNIYIYEKILNYILIFFQKFLKNKISKYI
jgi:hypothetical protein